MVGTTKKQTERRNAYDIGTHVSVDFVYRLLSARIQKILNVITAVFILLFALCICVYGYKYWWLGFYRWWRHFGMLDVPMSYTRIALPIAGLILVFQVAITIYDYIRAFRSTGEVQVSKGNKE